MPRLLLAPMLLAAFVQQGRPMMATWVSVRLPEGAEAQADPVFSAFEGVERELNEWRPGSPLARVNEAAGGEPVAVPPALLAAVQEGLRIARLTDGAFDPTWAALWGLWDFHAASPSPPKDAEIAARLPRIGYDRVQVDPVASTVRLPEVGMKLGLGGMAKGWALDRAAEGLRARGVRDFLLSAGGQVAVGGSRDGAPWRVGIRDPRGPADDFFAVIAARDQSVSTSGDYERCFVLGGVLYHHILDPRTGRPARGLRSATVIAPEATLADALSTAVMILGRERGLALLARLPGVEGLVVDSSGGWAATPGLLPSLKLVHPPRPDALPTCPPPGG